MPVRQLSVRVPVFVLYPALEILEIDTDNGHGCKLMSLLWDRQLAEGGSVFHAEKYFVKPSTQQTIACSL